MGKIYVKNNSTWGAKKAKKSYGKKKIREKSDTIDELFNKTSSFPFDAKSLNVGEDECMREINEKWEKQKEDEFKRNQSKFSD